MPYFVEYFDLGSDMTRACPDHNIVANSFEEIAQAADGRVFVITGMATEEEYEHYLETLC